MICLPRGNVPVRPAALNGGRGGSPGGAGPAAAGRTREATKT